MSKNWFWEGNNLEVTEGWLMIERKGVGYSQGDEGACRHWISRPGSHAQCLRGSSRHSKSRDQPGSSLAPRPPDHACCGVGGERSFCVKTHPILQGRHTTKFYRYSYFTYFKIIFTYLYFWLPWVFLTAHGNSSVATSRGYFSWWCPGFSLRWFFLWSTGSRAWAQQLWHTGLTAPRHGVFPDQG